MSGFNMPPGVSPSDIQGFDADDWRDEGNQSAHTALTLRDYFAAKTMLALVSGPHHEEHIASAAKASGIDYYSATSTIAFAMANAMLRERMKP